MTEVERVTGCECNEVCTWGGERRKKQGSTGERALCMNGGRLGD